MRKITLIIPFIFVILAAVLLSGCTGTNTPTATPTTQATTQSTTTEPSSVTATSTPQTAATSGPAITRTDNGYTLRGPGNSDTVKSEKFDLKAGSATFHIQQFNNAKQGYTFSIKNVNNPDAFGSDIDTMLVNQRLLLFSGTYETDKTVTKDIPEDGTYQISVLCFTPWQIDVTQ